MAKYRKRPVVIEAIQWQTGMRHPDYDPEGSAVVSPYCDHDSIKEWVQCKHCGKFMRDHGWIDTLEGGNDGAQVVCPGDWIITGVQGEHYPCKPDIFEATYEAVPPQQPDG